MEAELPGGFDIDLGVVDEEAAGRVDAGDLGDVAVDLGVGLGHAEVTGDEERLKAVELRVQIADDAPVIAIDVGEQHEAVVPGERLDEVGHAGDGLGVGLEPGGLEAGVREAQALRLDDALVDLRQGRAAGNDIVVGGELVEAAEGAGGVVAVAGEPLDHEVIVEGDEDAEQVEDDDLDPGTGDSHGGVRGATRVVAFLLRSRCTVLPAVAGAGARLRSQGRGARRHGLRDTSGLERGPKPRRAAPWLPAIAAAAVALALLAVACGSDDAPPTPPAESPTPSTGATPLATGTPEQQVPSDPSDPYFDLDRVLDIAIEIAPEHWETLRHQTRTFEDLIAEMEEYQLSRPFASIYTWFPATVTVDGETHAEVGVRKKGFLGSQSDTKPSLKLRFDKYVDGQALGGVMERMTLNNGVQDASLINTCLALQVFASAGIPASRCSFATVSVNGKDLGLYIHVEELKRPFLERHFASADGNLYEGTVSDFTPEFRGTIEKKTNEDEDDWSDVEAVVAALQDPSEAGLAALGEVVDLDRFLTFWAVEVLVGHWDGYAGNRNNYQFYREPSGRFVFIPWGVDQAFHLQEDPNPFDGISNPPPSVLALTAIPNQLYHHDEWRGRYVERLKELLDTVWDEGELLARVDELAAIVQEHARPEHRPAAAADTERVRQFILKRRAELSVFQSTPNAALLVGGELACTANRQPKTVRGFSAAASAPAARPTMNSAHENRERWRSGVSSIRSCR